MNLKLSNGQYLGSSKNSYPFREVIVSEIVYTGQVYEGWHYHENPHISLLVDGGNREQRRKHDFDSVAGTVLCYNAGEVHRNVNTITRSRNINIEILPAFYTRFNLPRKTFSSSIDQHLQLTLLKIFAACSRADADCESEVHSLLLNVLAQDEKSGEPRPRWMKYLVDLLNDRWSEELSLTEIAAAIGVHPVTISKGFPRYFGCTYNEYLRALKVNRALNLTRNTNMPLTKIAYTCGFFDQSHFIRNFRQYTGFSPRELRRF